MKSKRDPSRKKTNINGPSAIKLTSKFLLRDRLKLFENYPTVLSASIDTSKPEVIPHLPVFHCNDVSISSHALDRSSQKPSGSQSARWESVSKRSHPPDAGPNSARRPRPDPPTEARRNAGFLMSPRIKNTSTSVSHKSPSVFGIEKALRAEPDKAQPPVAQSSTLFKPATVSSSLGLPQFEEPKEIDGEHEVEAGSYLSLSEHSRIVESALLQTSNDLHEIFETKITRELQSASAKASEKASRSRLQLQKMIDAYRKRFNDLLFWLKKTQDTKNEVIELENEIETLRRSNESLREKHNTNLSEIREEYEILEEQMLSVDDQSVCIPPLQQYVKKDFPLHVQGKLDEQQAEQNDCSVETSAVRAIGGDIAVLRNENDDSCKVKLMQDRIEHKAEEVERLKRNSERLQEQIVKTQVQDVNELQTSEPPHVVQVAVDRVESLQHEFDEQEKQIEEEVQRQEMQINLNRETVLRLEAKLDRQRVLNHKYSKQIKTCESDHRKAKLWLKNEMSSGEKFRESVNNEFRLRHSEFRKVLAQMLESVETCQKVSENLYVGLCCSVCFNVLKDPVIVSPCGHTFCKKCMICLSQTPAGGQLKVCCPECNNGELSTEVVDNALMCRIVQQYESFEGPLKQASNALQDLCRSIQQRSAPEFRFGQLDQPAEARKASGQ